MPFDMYRSLRVGDEGDDALAAAEAARDFERGGDVRAGGGGAEDAFLARQPRDHVECGIVVDADHVVRQRHVEHGRDERRRADAFDFVRTGFAAFEDRALRLDDVTLARPAGVRAGISRRR